MIFYWLHMSHLHENLNHALSTFYECIIKVAAVIISWSPVISSWYDKQEMFSLRINRFPIKYCRSLNLGCMFSRPDWLEGNDWDSWDSLWDGGGVSGVLIKRYKQNDKLVAKHKLRRKWMSDQIVFAFVGWLGVCIL